MEWQVQFYLNKLETLQEIDYQFDKPNQKKKAEEKKTEEKKEEEKKEDEKKKEEVKKEEKTQESEKDYEKKKEETKTATQPPKKEEASKEGEKKDESTKKEDTTMPTNKKEEGKKNETKLEDNASQETKEEENQIKPEEIKEGKLELLVGFANQKVKFTFLTTPIDQMEQKGLYKGLFDKVVCGLRGVDCIKDKEFNALLKPNSEIYIEKPTTIILVTKENNEKFISLISQYTKDAKLTPQESEYKHYLKYKYINN